MIDLRSDTLTQPTAGMREAMASADVGDDVYAEDPTIAALEERTAALFGHEAGLFCVTGSLSNQLGVWTSVRPGQEILCDSGAHIARAEMGAHGALGGVTMRTWVTEDGVAETAQIERLLSPDAGPYLVSTAAVGLENTHNFGGGTIQPLEHLREVSALCRDAGVRLHLDGARIWNAHVATGIGFAEYGSLFDTVSVCFSKGLGAPVGSLLLGSADAVTRARVQRKRLGAGWRQAGVLAAAASFALDHQLDRLADDHAAARAFAAAVAGGAPGTIREPATNIVLVPTGERVAADVVAQARERGVALTVVGARTVRAVTHLDVSRADCERAGEIVAEILEA